MSHRAAWWIRVQTLARRSVLAGGGRRGLLHVLALLIIALAPASPASAGSPYIWDEDDDGMDDRIDSVRVVGFQFSFENADTLLRQRFLVTRSAGNLLYGVYVVYDHVPTPTDLASLGILGMPVLHRYENVPAVRSLATFVQASAASSLPGVDRIEAIPFLYPVLYENTAAAGVRDPSQRAFPTWEGAGGADGTGIVIGFIDTGINDKQQGFYPGHESLTGRYVGGASFVSGDSIFDTPRDGSFNPTDQGGAATSSHATHVSSIALGTGGPSGYARGVAPGARYVDVKALTDGGSGTGVAEAIDWCIHNRNRDWGVPGYQGIQVVNLSLSSPDQSDGNDVASRLAARAVALRMVVVASMGNEGLDAHVPSPAAGDGVIAVGAIDAQRTPLQTDDLFLLDSNRGPRASDEDLDTFDELKPDLLAPGLAVLAANGDLSTDGERYRRLSGTSMSAGFVSGAAAALLSENPGLTPSAVASLLRATAWRGIAGLPPGPGGADPRWQAARGFGALDLHAAWLELEQPGRSQVARLELHGSGETIDAVIRTQRERGADFYAIERAPDVLGSPGTFAVHDSVPAEGDSSLADPVNRTSYPRSWSVPVGERGQDFWYRVAYTEAGTRYAGPARKLTSPSGPSVVTAEITIVHNAHDHDLTGSLIAGESGDGPMPSSPEDAGTAFAILPGSSAAVETDWMDGTSTTGNVSWTFRLEIADPDAVSFLPPSNITKWKLHAHEGGYLNRSGRITSFKLTWHRWDGDVEFFGGPVPQQTVEGQETVVSVPQGVTAVGPGAGHPALRYGPNPVNSGGVVSFALAGSGAREVMVFDLAGRQVGRAALIDEGGVARAEWRAYDASGRPLAPGIYLARAGNAEPARIAVLK